MGYKEWGSDIVTHALFVSTTNYRGGKLWGKS